MPELEEDLDTYVSAFNWLTADRRTGFSIGPIPLSEIAHYYDRFGVEDEFEVFAHLVREMDNEYLKALKEKPSGDGT